MKLGGGIFVKHDRHVLLVKFIDNTEKEVQIHALQDFQALIDDHQKKIKTHTDKLQLLEQLKI